MNQILDIDYSDFYYNGHWLSEFDGIVAGRNGLSSFSLLPSLQVNSEKVLGNDGEFVHSAFYNPRTFSIPVLFNNISKLRQIAGWLNSKVPNYFLFRNDNIKIKCMIDGLIDLEPKTLSGIVELKFIAHDPYFYAVNDTLYAFSKPDYIGGVKLPIENANTIFQDIVQNIQLSSFTEINLFNDGNVESYPLYYINGSGEVSININGEVTQVTLSYGNTEIFIDSKYFLAYNNSFNMLNATNNKFVSLKSGLNIISATGNINTLQIKCRSKWI